MPIAPLAAVAMSALLLAHDIYPVDYCDGNAVTGDCRPVPCAEIEQVGPQQWRHGNAWFLANTVRNSIDDRCHVCKSGSLARCIMFPRPKTS